MDIKEKIVEKLDNLSRDIVGSTNCIFLWGEVEVPECLKEENQ